jgi:tyrosine-protein phosphatase SIW14
MKPASKVIRLPSLFVQKTVKNMSLSQHQRGLAVLALVISLPAWPAQVEAPGIPNFHQVNQHVFRGGQPAAEGWQSLAKLGVRTVIDLRRSDEHSTAAEAQEVKAAGMNYVNVPMKGVVAPTNEQIFKILSLLDSQEPVFVHCKRGADRTGTVIACYRIAHDRWERKQALNEAKSLGMRWAQLGLRHYVMAFQPAMWRPAVATELQPATGQP